MRYLDTSLLVAGLTKEATTARIQTWLAAQAAATLAISAWVVTEFSAALSLKLRTGDIDAQYRAEALAAFARLCDQAFSILAVSAGAFQTGARFADHSQLALRAGDALHLAICAEHGVELCTLDRRLAGAGPNLGVPTLLV
jgi:predicted nucleic acid-binding protein